MTPREAAMTRFAFCLGLAALVLAAFLPVGSHDFVNYDDGLYVTSNPVVQKGLTLEGLRWALTTRVGGNWHPVTWLSHMTDVELFGLDAGSHHLVNLAFHLANTVLLFLLLAGGTGCLWRSAAAAALFGVHPLHVESVAWIAERKDVLSTLFWLLTTGAYALWVRRGGAALLLATVTLFAAGLMTKPMLVTLPLTLLLLDRWPLARTGEGSASPGRLLFEKTPLFALSGAAALVALLLQAKEGAMRSTEIFPLSARLGNAAISAAAYLRLTLWPRSLAVFYPFRGDPPAAEIVATALLLVLISALVFSLRRREPALLTGWLWYLVTLLPVIGIVQVGWQSMADRYTYVPLVGVFVALVWGVADLVGDRRRLAAAALLLTLLPLAAAARLQTSYWRDSLSLFEHAIEVTEGNFVAHNSLAAALMAAGRDREAEAHLRRVVALRPDYEKAFSSLGTALFRQGREQEALEAFLHALRLRPAYPEAHFNAGVLLMRQGNSVEAQRHFEAAVAAKPGYAEAHNNLGGLLLQQGKEEEAIREFRSALAAKPGYAQARANLERLLSRGGRPEERGAGTGGAPPPSRPPP